MLDPATWCRTLRRHAAAGRYDAAVHAPFAAPLALPCGVEIANRFAKAAMTEGLADQHDDATAALGRLYRRWSDGGAGLLIAGNAMVDRRFLERSGNVVLDGATDPAATRAWAAAATRAGNQAWLQLNHPGRQCTRFHTREPLAPSAVPVGVAGFFARPRALGLDEIEELVGAFARAAAAAREASFTGLQVHAAHGYLVSQFLSPRTNLRRDAWGGSLAGRARFLLAIVDAVRQTVGPAFPLSVKLNTSDFQRGGFDGADAVAVARLLERAGVDLLELSGGTYERIAFIGHDGRAAATRAREAYFLDAARAVRAAAPRLPLMVTGGFRTPAAMARALAAGETDLLGIARPFCVEPDFPRRLLDGGRDALPSPEHRLRLAPGRWGPDAPAATWRALNAQAATAWFYEQIVRLGNGEEPRTRPGSGAAALARHVAREARRAIGRRRATEARRDRAAGTPIAEARADDEPTSPTARTGP